jgi:hypothetical protein
MLLLFAHRTSGVGIEAPCSKLQGIFDSQGDKIIVLAR